MKHEVQTLNVKQAATGAGTVLVVDRFCDKTVQVTGTFVASLDLEGSIDGLTFAPLIAGITAPGIFHIAAAVKLLRTNVTSYTSGQAAAVFGGLDARSF